MFSSVHICKMFSDTQLCFYLSEDCHKGSPPSYIILTGAILKPDLTVVCLCVDRDQSNTLPAELMHVDFLARANFQLLQSSEFISAFTHTFGNLLASHMKPVSAPHCAAPTSTKVSIPDRCTRFFYL